MNKPIRVKQPTSPVLNKDQAANQSVNTRKVGYETNVSFVPTDAPLTNTDYRGGLLKGDYSINPAVEESLKAYTTTGLSSFFTPGEIVVPNLTLGSQVTSYTQPTDFSRNVSGVTFVNPMLVEHTFFTLGKAYNPAYNFVSADYTSAGSPSPADIVSDLASAGTDRYERTTRWLARQVIAISEAVRNQGNTAHPFYSLTTGEIYDRLTDYFMAVNRAVVLLTNLKIISSDEFKNGVMHGARLLWDGAGYQSVKDIFSDNHFSQLVEIKTRMATILEGQYFVPGWLADYMLATISLLPNQDHGFRFIAPRLVDARTNIINTGADIFFNIADSAPNDVEVNSWITALKAEVVSLSTFFYGASAQVVRVGLTNFNQFPLLTDLLEQPAQLKVNSVLLADISRSKFRIGGVNRYVSPGTANSYLGSRFTNSGNLGYTLTGFAGTAEATFAPVFSIMRPGAKNKATSIAVASGGTTMVVFPNASTLGEEVTFDDATTIIKANEYLSGLIEPATKTATAAATIAANVVYMPAYVPGLGLGSIGTSLVIPLAGVNPGAFTYVEPTQAVIRDEFGLSIVNPTFTNGITVLGHAALNKKVMHVISIDESLIWNNLGGYRALNTFIGLNQTQLDANNFAALSIYSRIADFIEVGIGYPIALASSYGYSGTAATTWASRPVSSPLIMEYLQQMGYSSIMRPADKLMSVNWQQMQHNYKLPLNYVLD